MATVKLGREPDELEVHVAAGAAFLTTLLASQDWPAGTVIELRFPQRQSDPIVWPAAITGRAAAFDEPPARVDELLAARGREAQLWYRAGADGPLLRWAQGPVTPA